MSRFSHPNRLPFKGILTRINEPSDKPPSGSRGHRVVLSTEAAEQALPSLIGMGVGFKNGWAGHDARQKCGVITHATLDQNDLRIEGYLYDHDFPEVGAAIRTMDMGMSYELIDAHIQDMRAAFWNLTQVTFSGAAILLRLKAAYHGSYITVNADAPTA